MSATPRFSQFDVYFFYITMAQTVEKNAGLGHAWQKMVCLFTDRRGIDAKPRFISKISQSWNEFI